MRIRIVSLGSILLMLMIVLISLSIQVQAQDNPTATSAPNTTATSAPSPTGNGGTAEWAIQSQSFTSNYPQGFTFTLQATSSAGDIKSVSILWRYSPTSGQHANATYDPATKTWTAAWSAVGADIPAWVGVRYWYVLVDAQGNTYQTADYQTEYADTSKEWGRAESDDIIVFWEKSSLPDDFGQQALDAMAQNREKYRAGWGGLISYKPRAIVYGNEQTFEEWQLGSPNKNAVGLTDAKWGGTVQYNYLPDVRFTTYGTIPHEVEHLYQADYRMQGPSWWIEGDATFYEIDQQYDYLAKARRLGVSGQIPAFQDGMPTTGDQARDGYDVGYSLVRYLVETYGIDVHRKIAENQASGKPLFAAIAAATNKPFPEIEYDYRTWLGIPDPTVPTALPTMGIPVFASPTYPPIPGKH